MKILLFSLSNHFTFQETSFNLKKYIEMNTEHSVAVITGDRKSYHNETDNNVFRIGYTYKNINPIYHIKKISEIVKTIKDFNPTHIVFINSHPINYYISKKFLKEMNIFNIIHDVIPHHGDKNASLVRFYNRRITKVSDFIIVHSESFVELFESKYSFPKNKILFTKLWREYGQYSELNETNTCLFFGRINPYKGISNVIEIAKRLQHIKFNVVGKWDKSMEALKTDLAQINNVKVIDYTISSEEMEKYFIDSELVMIPYESASQSGVIIDAYKYSRPVVTFNVGGLSEQVIDSKTGYLVEEGNLDKFILVIDKHMSKSKKLKSEISYHAWNYGKEEYSTQLGYLRLLSLLERGEKKQ